MKEQWQKIEEKVGETLIAYTEIMEHPNMKDTEKYHELREQRDQIIRLLGSARAEVLYLDK